MDIANIPSNYRSQGRSGTSGKQTMPSLNIDKMEASQVEMSKFSFRDIESATYKEVLLTFRENKIDVIDNISKFAKIVK
jgi:hypothetical protein